MKITVEAPFTRTIARGWVSLTDPIPAVTNKEARRQSRLLVRFLLIVVAIGLPVEGATFVSSLLEGRPYLPVSLVALATLSAAYILARRGDYKRAAWITILVSSIATYILTFLPEAGPVDVDFLTFLFFPLILASVFITQKQLLGLGSLLALAMLGSPLFSKDTTLYNVVYGPVSFILLATGAIYAVSNHQKLLEKDRQRDLEEREERYRTLVETSYEGICIHKNGAILDANPGFAHMFGYSVEEVIGKSWVDFALPEHRRLVSQDFHARRGHVYSGVRKDGSQIYLEAITRDQPYQGQTVEVTIVRDVSERVLKEKALSASEERYRTLAEAAHDAIFVIDRDDHVQYLNSYAASLFGLRPEELIHQPRALLFPSKEDDRQKNNLLNIFETGEPMYHEHEEVYGGHKIWQSTWLVAIRNKANEVEAVLGIARDITVRKQAEETLKESQRKMLALVTSLDDIVFELDERGTYLNVWTSNKGLLARPEEEVIGHNITEIFGADLARPFLEAFKRVMRSGQSENIEYSLEVPAGQRWFLARINPVSSNGASYQTFSVLVRDVTEVKKAENEAQTRTEELETLFSISTRLREVRNVDEMWPMVLSEICKVLEADTAVLILLDPDERQYRVALANGSMAVNSGRSFNIDEGVTGHIFKTHQTYMTDDYSRDPLRLSSLDGTGRLGPAIFVPLQSESRILGVLLAARQKLPQTQPFTTPSARVLSTISGMVGTTLRRLRLFEEAQSQLHRIQALREIDATILSSMDLRISLLTILDHVRSRIGVDAACILILNSKTLTLDYAAGRGFQTDIPEHSHLRLGTDYAGQAALEWRAIHIPDLRDRQIDFLRSRGLAEENFVMYYATPLIARGQVRGVLEIYHREPLALGVESTDFLQALANQTAITIDHISLFNDAQHSHQELILAYDATIEGWSRALDLRDKETEGHTLRVTEMTLDLARAMNFDENKLIHVRRGAILHDIGKMGIPDSILLKPGKLTEEEWAEMKKHPVYAYEMLSPIAYLGPALEIPYCHHEKWDGSGYPRGLRGKAIPLSARIFAVVDVWDALTNDRPYRPAWSTERTLSYIREQAGIHFDPDVVRVFLKFIERNRDK